LIPIPNTNTSRVFVAWIAIEILIILFPIASYGGATLEALHITTRFSGRLSLIAFSAILLTRGKSSAPGWVSDKPFHLFATLHGIHLAELLLYVTWSGTTPIPIRLLGGALAYAFIFVMPLASTKFAGPKMSKMEIAFFSYVWMIFFLTYLPRVLGKLPNVGGTFTEHVILFAWVILLGLSKMMDTFRNKEQY
jgi:hypothetical protein